MNGNRETNKHKPKRRTKMQQHIVLGTFLCRLQNSNVKWSNSALSGEREPNLVPRAFSSTIFKMADRQEKTLANAALTALLIGPFIPTRWLVEIHPKEIWRTWRERKGYRRLYYCSSFQTMLNQTGIIDSKGESFPFDFNLQDVNHNIEVEISPGKHE